MRPYFEAVVVFFAGLFAVPAIVGAAFYFSFGKEADPAAIFLASSTASLLGALLYGAMRHEDLQRKGEL